MSREACCIPNIETPGETKLMFDTKWSGAPGIPPEARWLSMIFKMHGQVKLSTSFKIEYVEISETPMLLKIFVFLKNASAMLETKGLLKCITQVAVTWKKKFQVCQDERNKQT
jgi:hypothetical protein